MQAIHFLNTKVHNLTMQETVEHINSAILEHKQIHYADLNAGKIVDIQDDLYLRENINTADIINADGQAVVWASKFLRKPIKERVAGVDLMDNLVRMAAEKDYKIYLLGAKEEVVSKLVQIYSEKYGENLVVGYRNGYFKKEEEADIIKDIVQSGAQMLFVAISSPTKENFLYQHREALSQVNFIMGVGGSFDVFAGKVKRAPVWMQKIGMEWFYRFLQEPKRMWRRYLIGNSKFIYLVFKEKWQKTSPIQD
ncbi:MAG TPA: WecB/TagA/CpsF family glycosyltransferase [Flavobacteriaceae bacterium]|nr:WecB/TagA/CpsF family glycosyltransferase [Flavobacteriaceae bacterium]